MEQNNFDLKKVKVHRTAEATILEVVFAIVAELTLRQLRIAGIFFLLLPLAVAYIMLGMNTPSPTPLLIVIGLIFLVFIVFTILIYKAK